MHTHVPSTVAQVCMGTLEWKGGWHGVDTKAKKKMVGKTHFELSVQLPLPGSDSGLAHSAESMLKARCLDWNPSSAVHPCVTLDR